MQAKGGRTQTAARRRSLPSFAPDEAALREAVAACDAEILWHLLQAYRTLDVGKRTAPDGKPSSTPKVYRAGLRQLMAYLASRGLTLDTMDSDDAALWVRGMEAPGEDVAGKPRPAMKAATVRAYLAGARALVTALRQSGLLDTDPFEFVHPGREPRAPWERRRAYSAAEVEALVQALQDMHHWPLLVAVLLGSDAGLRASEMVSLTFLDVDWELRQLRIGQAKGGKSRVVAMSPRLAGLLRTWQGQAGSLRVWPYSASWLRKELSAFCLAQGLPYRALHALRHAHATGLATRGVPLAALAEQMGHSSLQSSEAYLKSPGLQVVHALLADLLPESS